MGADGWKDVLQLLRKQNEKMEKLARALSVIQQSMLRNNPRHVTNSVNEATELLCGMLNTHTCLLESGMEIQKRLESHLVTKQMEIIRTSRSASLGDTPKSLTKGKIKAAASPPAERTSKKGRGGSSPSYAQVCTEELGYATGMNLRAEGKLDAAQIIEDVLLGSPSRAPKYRPFLDQSHEVPFPDEAALALLFNNNLLRSQYLGIRYASLEHNSKLFPSYHKVLAAKAHCYPTKSKIKITESCAEVKLVIITLG